MLAALGAATDLPEDLRRTLGLSAAETDAEAVTPAPKSAARKPARNLIVHETNRGGGGAKLGTACRLKRVVFEQKMTLGGAGGLARPLPSLSHFERRRSGHDLSLRPCP